MNIRTLLLGLLLVPMTVLADVEFRASAPAQVIVGRPFQLTYTINQRARDFQAPDFEHFDVLAGPYTSQSSSTSFVNGKMSSTFTLTYTYTMRAMEEGTFTIAPARVKADGDYHQSNGVRITVLPEDEQPDTQGQATRQAGPRSGQQPQQQTSQRAQTNSAGGAISSENIFIRTIVTKTNVHEQEALLLSYKLYFAGVDVAQFTNNTKLPDFTGFLKQEIDLGDIQTELEHYNGRNYQTATLYQALLYPQHSGDIKIDPAAFEAVLRVQTRGQVRSIFDDFFGSYTNVTRPISAPAVTIHVEPLPTGKPANFSGAVGSFQMIQSLDKQNVTTNEPITLHLEIKGTGNMKLIKTLAVEWPEGFEVYDPKVTNNFRTTTAGVTGTKSIEYLAIPRAAGDYTIPAVTFSYFDTKDKEYKTLSTPEYTLHVNRGANDAEPTQQATSYTGVNKENIKTLGTDIRYIYLGTVETTETPQATFIQPATQSAGSISLYYLCPFGLGVLLFIIFYRRIRENADQNRVRYKKANKVAQKRLKAAAKILQGGASEAFYAEIERAAFQYLSDRLSIPTSDMSKDTIASQLRSKNVDETLIQEVSDVLSTAEFARYAPSTTSDAEALYDRTVKLIDTLESAKL